jgi:arsenite-transporting ATPase
LQPAQLDCGGSAFRLSLLSPCQRLLLFSGKGGVGKTTLTCALARHLAQAQPERRLLLLSTDPAHSLGDVLGIPVADVPQPLPDWPNLQVRALQAEVLLQDFKQTYGPALELIAERGSWLAKEDLLPLWDLDWPGVDELMAILEVNRLLAGQEVDTVILDTAPTGHTLRLLELPDFLDNLLAVFATFQAKHREVVQSLTGAYRPDEADAFLARLQSELEGGKARLTDPESTAAWLVLIPEPLSVADWRPVGQPGVVGSQRESVVWDPAVPPLPGPPAGTAALAKSAPRGAAWLSHLGLSLSTGGAHWAGGPGQAGAAASSLARGAAAVGRDSR